MLAARLAVEDLVEELIAARADVGARDKRGMHRAAVVSKCWGEREGGEVQTTGAVGTDYERLLGCGSVESEFPHHGQLHVLSQSVKREWKKHLRERAGDTRPTDPEQYLLSRPRAHDVTRAALAADSRLPGQRFPPLKNPSSSPFLPPPPTKARTRGKLKRSSLTPSCGVTGSHVVP